MLLSHHLPRPENGLQPQNPARTVAASGLQGLLMGVFLPFVMHDRAVTLLAHMELQFMLKTAKRVK